VSNEQEQVVGIEEALARAYLAYANYAYIKIRDDFHDFDFIQAVYAGIKPQPESTHKGIRDIDLIHLYHLIKNANMKAAEDAVAKYTEAITRFEERPLSFKVFVEDLVDTCKSYGDVQEEAQS